MKPDWEVIRKILLKIEELPKAGSLNSKEFTNEIIDSVTVAYNIVILFDYGLIDGILKRGTSGSLLIVHDRSGIHEDQTKSTGPLRNKPGLTGVTTRLPEV